MRSPDHREPTNEQLGAQPPAAPEQAAPRQGLAPAPHGQVPAPHTPAQPPAAQRTDRSVFALAIVSLALGVPLTAISGEMAGLPGLLIAWVGIVLVNVIYGWSRRGR